MNKATIFLLVLFLVGISFSSGVPIPTMPNPKDSKTSKTQWGIIGSCTAWYLKIRTCVRYCYDEIKYWEGTVNSYKKLNTWFSNNKNFITALSDSSSKLFTDPKDVFVTLERLENVFDGIDYLTFNQTRKFDALMYGMENSWNRFAADTFVYTINLNKSASCTLSHTPGLLVPNTGEVLSFIDRNLFCDSSNVSSSADDNIVIDDPFDVSQYSTITDIQDWPESRLKTANEIIAAHALAHSSQYRLWSHRAMSRVEKTDSILSSVSKGANGKEMAATWYALENINANNKKLRHSVEEAKVLEAMLGTELFYKSLRRSQAMKQTFWAKDMANALGSH